MVVAWGGGGGVGEGDPWVIVVLSVCFSLLPDSFSMDEATRIFSVLDIDGNGVLDYSEFVRGFRVRIRARETPTAGEGFERLQLDRVRPLLRGLCCCFCLAELPCALPADPWHTVRLQAGVAVTVCRLRLRTHVRSSLCFLVVCLLRSA